MSSEHIDYQVDIKDISRKGRKIFESISKDLEKEHFGKVVAIDAETGDYFLADTGIEATKKARKKYPSSIFFLARIGYRTYISFSGRR